MEQGEIEITHDFYLKKFQLEAPMLQYDFILFDEGQDASAAMLDVFLKQKATKVIVGDTNQQIYGWRFAVNSLEKIILKRISFQPVFVLVRILRILPCVFLILRNMKRRTKE